MGLLDDAIREHLELKRRRGADAGAISREESEALGPVRRGPDGAPDLSDTGVPAPPAAEPPPPVPAWESDQTAVLGTTPPPGLAQPPSPAPAHEPPAAPESPASVSGYQPPPTPAYQPPPVPAPAHEPPPRAEPDRPWFERAHDVPEQEGEDFGVDPAPHVEAGREPEHTSLLGRFRVGRKHKGERQPAPSEDEPAPGYAPPPLPDSYAPASPYEPPPMSSPPAPPSYASPPQQLPHEPDIVPADDEPLEDVLEETPDFLEETPEHDRLWFEQRPPRDFDFDDK
jgi:formin 2